MDPLGISVAITGGVHGKEVNPHLPRRPMSRPRRPGAATRRELPWSTSTLVSRQRLRGCDARARAYRMRFRGPSALP